MANRYDLRITQRATFEREFEYRESDGETVIPLTGATAKAQIRKRAGAPDPPLAEFEVVIDQPNGTISILLTDEETGALPIGRLEYDVLVTMDDVTFVLVEGYAVIDGTVTV